MHLVWRRAFKASQIEPGGRTLGHVGRPYFRLSDAKPIFFTEFYRVLPALQLGMSSQTEEPAFSLCVWVLVDSI